MFSCGIMSASIDTEINIKTSFSEIRDYNEFV